MFNRNNSMSTFFKKLTYTLLLLVSMPTHAITISLEPSSQTTNAGSSFEVALVVSMLGSGTAPSIGVFDLDVGFDPSLLDFTNAIFGDPLLGDQLDLFGSGNLSSITPGSGTVNLYELSFDLATDLDSLQADSFMLATLSFNALSVGTSSMNVFVNAIGDANGHDLTIDSIVAGNINVDAGSVPEPAIWMLLGLGLSALTMNCFNRRLFKKLKFPNFSQV
jgi:hypothetical protein